MRLYLVQHGKSLSKDEDPECPLSPEGLKDIANISAVLHRRSVILDRIYHSVKLRAKQTAKILAQTISEVDPVEMEGLKPMDPVGPIADQIATWEEDTMLVGHMPFISRLLNKLLGLPEDFSVVAFKPGSVACLQKNEDGKWVINWVLRTKLI